MLLATQKANAYNFYVVNNDGDTLYYNITSYTSPMTVEVTYTYIGENDYTGDITIPDSVIYKGGIYTVTAIGNMAFYDCTNLTSVTIPNSVTIIKDDAFSACDKLADVTIGNSVTIIGYNAFAICPRLTEVIFPNSVISIGESAFYACMGLTSITISNSTISIGDYAFAACTGLTGRLTIPNSVITIGEYAFGACMWLTSLTIGSSVTSIGERAFFGCLGLTEVYVKAETPPSLDTNVFEYVPDTIPVYIPCGKETVYKNAHGWDYFPNIVDNLPFEITTQSNDTEMGTAKITAPNTCANNNTAVIAAVAYTGYRFLQWNDGNTENPRTITVTKDTIFTATFDVETAITDIKTSAINIYPNPATDNINISLPENVSQAVFTLYDMQGRILIRQEVSSKESVAVNNLSSGIYIYNVRTSKQNYQGKLIRK
jgi:hypothetical protein